MEIQKTIVSEHKLIVDGQLFIEKKEYEVFGSYIVCVLDSKQIGNENFPYIILGGGQTPPWRPVSESRPPPGEKKMSPSES